MNDQLLQSAWRHHQAGKFAEAARLYHDVLKLNPNHFGALQMLGFLHFQRGEFADAERIMERAIRLQPQSIDAIYNRGCALQALSRFTEALSCFDRTLTLKPDHAPAMLNRGNTLSQLGRFEDALTSYDLASVFLPDSIDLLVNRGNTLFEMNRLPEALANYDKALTKAPQQAMIWNNRGNILSELGRAQDALISFNRALQIEPNYLDALVNRGSIRVTLKEYDAALSDYEKALGLDPSNVEVLHKKVRALSNTNRFTDALACCEKILVLQTNHLEAGVERGVALIALKRHDQALAAFGEVLRIAPNNLEALSNSASLLIRAKRYEDALRFSDRTLTIEPKYSAALHNRASALAGMKRYREAVEAFDKALAAAPDNATTWNGRGGAMLPLKQEQAALHYFEAALQRSASDPNIWSNRARAYSSLKRYAEAIADSDRALALDANNVQARRVSIHCHLHTCDWRNRVQEKATISSEVGKSFVVISALDHRGMCDSESEHFRVAQLWAAEECPPALRALWTGERYAHDKIRIAYLSTDFRAHAVAFLIVGIFEHHDKSRFETTAISIGADDKSETRARIASAFDHFIDARSMSDLDIALLMCEKEIDIAIDLNGFTGDPRTEILAYRPAPVQVNYLGYPGTMGAPYIDYIIADRIVVPPEHRAYCSEKVVYLPGAYQPNDRHRRVAAIPTRAEAGLPEAGFVFCSFNNNYKIGPEIFDVWMRLLNDVDGSVLWLLQDNAFAVDNLRHEALARGVAPERLIFAPRKMPDEHLARHRLADLFLDTLPYNAHTTASDALWMGLPLVTCPGTSFPSRVAASLLRAIGLPELVSDNLGAYQSLALALAREPERLAAIKNKLAANRDTHPLFDTARSTRQLESAFTHMWERQQHGLPPEAFDVAE